MNIEEKKLNAVKNEIKEIFDNVYERDTEKVFWYLVAVHIIKVDSDVKFKVEGKKVQISDFRWDDEMSYEYDDECELVKSVDVSLIYNLAVNDTRFWNENYGNIVNFIIDYYFSIDKIGEEHTTPDEISSLMAHFVQLFGSSNVIDPCAGMCGIAFQPEMKNVTFWGMEIDNRIKVLSDIKLSTLYGTKRCDRGNALDSYCYGLYDDIDTLVSDLPFCVKANSNGMTIEDHVIRKFIEIEEVRHAVLMVSPSFVNNNVSRLHRDIVDKGYVEKVITLPASSYSRTSVTPVMLVLNKDRSVDYTTFVDARDCGSKKGRLFVVDCEMVKERLYESNSIFKVNVNIDGIVANNYSLNQVHYLKEVYDISPDEKLVKFSDVATPIKCVKELPDVRVRFLTKNDFTSTFEGSLLEYSNAEYFLFDKKAPRIVSEPCVIANFTFTLYYIKKDYDPVNVPVRFKVYRINENICLPEYFVYKMREIRKNGSPYECGTVEKHLAYIPLYPLESQRQILARAYRCEKEQMLKTLSRLNVLSDKSSDLLHNLGVIFTRIGSAAAAIGNVNDNIELKTIDCNAKFAIRQINMSGTDFSQVCPILKKVNVLELVDEYLDEWQLAGFKSFGTRETHSIPEDTKIKVDVDLFKTMMDCILINAHQHGFNRRYSSDNTMSVTVDGARFDNKLYVKIELANNGNPLPDGLTLEDFVARGVVGVNSSQDGIGGDHILQIIHHFGGKMAIEQTSKWFSVLLFIPVYLTSDDSDFYDTDYECI